MDFVRSYFDKNEPLTSWTLFSSLFVQISADLEKKWGQKCSTGQRFICTEVTSYKIHILDGLDKSHYLYQTLWCLPAVSYCCTTMYLAFLWHSALWPKLLDFVLKLSFLFFLLIGSFMIWFANEHHFGVATDKD